MHHNVSAEDMNNDKMDYDKFKKAGLIKFGPRGMLVYHMVMHCIVAATTARMFKQHNRRLIASSPMCTQELGDVNCEEVCYEDFFL